MSGWIWAVVAVLAAIVGVLVWRVAARGSAGPSESPPPGDPAFLAHWTTGDLQALEQEHRRSLKAVKKPWPHSVRLTEDGLRVWIHAHVIDDAIVPVTCWTYVSDGLLEHGQAEVSVTLKRRADEDEYDYPLEPARFLAQIGSLAGQGHLVGPYGITLMRGDGVLGFQGVLYLPHRPVEDVAVPEGTLTAILIHGEECENMKLQGVTSIVARLGADARQYPCPIWADRDRRPLALPEPEQLILWTAMPHLCGEAVSCVYIGDRLVLRLSGEASTALARALQEEEACSRLLLELWLDPAADSCYAAVQAPEPSAVVIHPAWSSADARSLCHLMMVAGKESTTWAIQMDGFSLLLDADDLEVLCSALRSGEECELRLTEDLTLAVEVVPDSYFTYEFWGRPPVPSTYASPFDGRVLTAAWDWVSAKEPSRGAGSKREGSLVVLTDLAVVARNLSDAELQEVTSAVGKVMDSLGEDAAGTPQIRIECTLAPERAPRYRVLWNGSASDPAGARLLRRLEALPDVRTRREEIGFHFASGDR